ncbi:hypothetical protein JW711_04405 [Candidatus Woesearchaeota archaeon]|nr:hypothetical protein [Candidatus Woesearchaeota archaeon]
MPKAIKGRKLGEQDIYNFVNEIGHSLKAPLTNIKGFSELLKDKKIASNPLIRTKFINRIHENSEKMHSAIIDIQDSIETYLTGEDVERDEDVSFLQEARKLRK